MYDVLIRGGQVVDGTGTSGVYADVAIADDTFVAIGRLEAEAARTIDATGLVVAPGFIDLHSHADFNFFIDPTADSKITQGVTLELVGNCGMSFCAPLIGEAAEDLATRSAWYGTGWRPSWTEFGGYLDELEKQGATLNVATQVGHGTVRKAVMGSQTRAPSPEEQSRMQALVGESLDAGALGFSTGLSMPPGYYALTPEVIALAKEAASRGKLYSTHARDSGDEGSGLFVAIEEALEIGRRTGVKVEFSHIKCNGSTRGRSPEVIARIEAARKEGIDIAADVYPYIAASGPMSGNVFPRWAMDGGRQKALERMADADLRAMARAHLDERISSIGGPERLMVASYPPNREFEGRDLPNIAVDLKCDPAEALVRLFEKYDVQLILSGMAQADLDRFLASPFVAVASDGSSIKSTGPLSAGNPHPRSYGTFPRFIDQAVRASKLVSLEEAVRKMTTLPAERLGLTRRGRLAAGYAADVAVFDPWTLADRATFSEPHQYSTGIEYVLVNGVPVVDDGKPTGRMPGRVLRDKTT
ncbi:MAG: D-aminoacylase [Chloroflexi bacterium]|nr:D-aminoacylase [Chloroflexota bacterium]